MHLHAKLKLNAKPALNEDQPNSSHEAEVVVPCPPLLDLINLCPAHALLPFVDPNRLSLPFHPQLVQKKFVDVRGRVETASLMSLIIAFTGPPSSASADLTGRGWILYAFS
jgi:hypothetical protein